MAQFNRHNSKANNLYACRINRENDRIDQPIRIPVQGPPRFPGYFPTIETEEFHTIPRYTPAYVIAETDQHAITRIRENIKDLLNIEILSAEDCPPPAERPLPWFREFSVIHKPEHFRPDPICELLRWFDANLGSEHAINQDPHLIRDGVDLVDCEYRENVRRQRERGAEINANTAEWAYLHMQNEHSSNQYSIVRRVIRDKAGNVTGYVQYARKRKDLAYDPEAKRFKRIPGFYRRKRIDKPTTEQLPLWIVTFVNPLRSAVRAMGKELPINPSVRVIAAASADDARKLALEKISRKNRQGRFAKREILSVEPAKPYDPATCRENPAFHAAVRRTIRLLSGAGIDVTAGRQSYKYDADGFVIGDGKVSVSGKPTANRVRCTFADLVDQLESDCNWVYMTKPERRDNPCPLACRLTLNHFTRRAGERIVGKTSDGKRRETYIPIADLTASADARTERGKHARHGGNVRLDQHSRQDIRMDLPEICRRAKLTTRQGEIFDAFVQGYTYTEIAERLKISQPAVSKAMKTIIVKMTNVLTRNGYRIDYYYDVV